jgi:hypothetical protein
VLADVADATDGMVDWKEVLLQRMTIHHIGKSGAQSPHVQLQKLQGAIEFALKTGDTAMMEELRPAFYAALELPTSPLKLLKKEANEQKEQLQNGGAQNPLEILAGLGMGGDSPNPEGTPV